MNKLTMKVYLKDTIAEITMEGDDVDTLICEAEALAAEYKPPVHKDEEDKIPCPLHPGQLLTRYFIEREDGTVIREWRYHPWKGGGCRGE